jgi:hypothetical protein
MTQMKLIVALFLLTGCSAGADVEPDEPATHCSCVAPVPCACLPVATEPGPYGAANPLTPPGACVLCDEDGGNCYAWVVVCADQSISPALSR